MQHVTVLNTVGNCNTMVVLCYRTTVVFAVRRWPERRYAAHNCIVRIWWSNGLLPLLQHRFIAFSKCHGNFPIRTHVNTIILLKIASFLYP